MKKCYWHILAIFITVTAIQAAMLSRCEVQIQSDNSYLHQISINMNMNTTITGKILDIFPAELYGNFEKRVCWVEETEGEYPNTYSLEFWQGDCNKLDSYKPGDAVSCKVDIRGRKWTKNGKEGVINTLKCWSISKQGATQQQANATQQAQHSTATQTVSDAQDDLPF